MALLSSTGSDNAHARAPSNGHSPKLCIMNASFTDVIDLLLKTFFSKSFGIESEKGTKEKLSPLW